MAFVITTTVIFLILMFLQPTPWWDLIQFGWRAFWSGVLFALAVSVVVGGLVEVIYQWLI